ncbi:MAG: c-type cytochrome [Helicobacteraceae bacterium]|jgi:cytochrome c5|nr:c-type cytochrome [Helicobacteraceae bacterium]
MLKINKLIISASIAASAALLMTACNSGATASGAAHSGATAAQTAYANGKAVIDGGVIYPVVNGKTADYVVDMQAENTTFDYGRTPTANELAAWNTDVTPHKAPPAGSGSVEDGEMLYEDQCVMCHGDFGSGGGGYPSLAKGKGSNLKKTLTNQRFDPNADGPTRVFGSYWPHASTMWWYIHDGMPHPKSKSLSIDETYALTAYMLNINEIEVDGQVADQDFVLDQDNFSKIVMPNVDGFEPKIDGPEGVENVRKYYADNTNFGGQKVNPSERCMKDCLEPTAKEVKISGTGISDFLPPISTVRDLPVEEGAVVPGAADYEVSCAVCHGAAGMGAPVVGDKAAWAAVAEKGPEAILANSINGLNAMPPRGGTDLSDAKLKDIVNYMINASK